MGSTKDHINDMTYNVKDEFSLNLDKIIDSEYEKAFEILDKYVARYIKNEYGIDNYKMPELVILEDNSLLIGTYLPISNSFVGRYVPALNQIIFSKNFIERFVNSQLKFLGYKRGIEEIMNRRLKFLGYKEIKVSISDAQDIGYLYIKHNLLFLYPSYINDRNKKESIAEFIVRLATFHEGLHLFDYMILHKLAENSIIEYINYSDNISNNGELRATASEVVMDFLASGLYKDERVYIPVYSNIPICRTYIEKLDILEKNKNTKEYVPYDLGFCYGNIIVAKYGPSLKENIYKIIDDFIHLNEERAIDEIKNYVYNPDKLLHDWI